jgi:hypothetical protein
MRRLCSLLARRGVKPPSCRESRDRQTRPSSTFLYLCQKEAENNPTFHGASITAGAEARAAARLVLDSAELHSRQAS